MSELIGSHCAALLLFRVENKSRIRGGTFESGYPSLCYRSLFCQGVLQFLNVPRRERRELSLHCYLRARSLLWGVVKRNEECWLQRTLGGEAVD